MVYNFWTIFMRLGILDKHAEVLTSRPLALHVIARQTRHGNQTTVEVGLNIDGYFTPLFTRAARNSSPGFQVGSLSRFAAL